MSQKRHRSEEVIAELRKAEVHGTRLNRSTAPLVSRVWRRVRTCARTGCRRTAGKMLTRPLTTTRHAQVRPITRVSHSLGPCSTIAHGKLPASTAG